MKVVVLAALVASGCLRNSDFHCTMDSQCGSDGQCETDLGFCSIPDRNCLEGRRYAPYSGPYTNQCVIHPDASVSNCAPGFAALPGVTGHLYHAFMAPSDFTTQRTACAAQGPTTYLAIPDDAAELQAIVNLAAQPAIWVGIDDEVVQGNFLTVRGMPAPYLPWAAGQPDNKPNATCVAALPDATLEDQVCTTSLRAVCECEP